jgi:hypothetical protein
MNEEIAKIRESLNTLENHLGRNESRVASPFSGLELPDIMRDVVDLLLPLLGTYEVAFYLYMLRHSIIESGSPHIRVGVRPLQRIVKSAYAGSTIGGGDPISKISETKVRDTLNNLESIGAIRKENEPNREGTLYRILRPEEIEACQNRRHKLQKVLVPSESSSEPDYLRLRRIDGR